MRFALEDVPRPQSERGAPVTLPAPYGGLNTRDPIVSMDRRYAIQLDNWIPRERNCEVREGSRQWATGLNGRVQSLMVYHSPSMEELWAATPTAIWDASTSGALGAATVSGLTSGFWEYTNFTTIGGSFLHAVNGSDDLQLYDGTTWTAINGGSTPAITGVNTNALVNINVFKRRIFFIEKDSLSAWYLPIDAIAGAAVELPLGPLFSDGGKLIAMGTWSIDAGDGVDDYAIFVTNKGQVAVFAGTDPASALTWALTGTFRVPKPIGRRCLQKYAGDLLLITDQGIFPLSKALLSSTVDKTVAVTDLIAPTFTAAAQTLGAVEGWQMALYSEDNLLVVNIPSLTGSPAQYVMNTITKAWCRWLGLEAYSWGVFQKQLMFGGSSTVGQALYGVQDNGVAVEGTMITAYNAFGRGMLTHVKLYRLLMEISDSVELGVLLIPDFELGRDFQEASITLALSVWDTDLWDTAVWSADAFTPLQWQTCFQRPAHYLAVGLRATVTDARVSLNAINLIAEKGSLI